MPKVKTGHVAPGIPLARVKDRLSQVKGALVEAPLVRVHLGRSAVSSDLVPGLFD